MRRHFLKQLVGVAMLGACAAAQAQGDFPSRPLKLVVAFAPGSAPDLMARSYAEKLKQVLGQTIIVENRPRATGAIGADAVVRSPADGHTLLLNSSAMVINPWVVKQPFDFQKDLVPVIRTAGTPYVITVNKQLPIRDLDEFIAYAKAHPGKMLCATYGVASPPHLALELLRKEAGLDIVHVPYKTFGQILPDLVSGQLSCSIDPPTGPMAQVQAGKIRAVAHTGVAPMEIAPGLDAIGKRYPRAAVIGWQAIFASAGTPADALDRLRGAWQEVIHDPGVVLKIREAGFEPIGDTIEAFSLSIAEDYKKFGDVIQENHIRLE